MRTRAGSFLLASTLLTINMIATGCTVKATLKETTDTSSNILGTTSGHAWWNEDGILNPDHIAENYWMLHSQPRDAWTHELDLRPWVEKF